MATVLRASTAIPDGLLSLLRPDCLSSVLFLLNEDSEGLHLTDGCSPPRQIVQGLTRHLSWAPFSFLCPGRKEFLFPVSYISI